MRPLGISFMKVILVDLFACVCLGLEVIAGTGKHYVTVCSVLFWVWKVTKQASKRLSDNCWFLLKFL